MPKIDQISIFRRGKDDALDLMYWQIITQTAFGGLFRGRNRKVAREKANGESRRETPMERELGTRDREIGEQQFGTDAEGTEDGIWSGKIWQ